ncbi:hypothetical protein [Nocardiopsis dassonvillei]|uniref:hypothetical protein n=1 Tax=Nocardiopsis dassonvillei TaxID=2014 RepID=UPI00037E59A8|nr:hypothetical protein [Nocardiopsis dassonvillei]MCK9872435.1 hypothetical protein [Nocardiopsis dassonvillei]
MAYRTPPRQRLLLMDGSPGGATLLVLAARGAIPTFDAVLVPDTRWYPAQTYRYLERLRRIATEAAMPWHWAATSDTTQDCLNRYRSCPLPLFTLTPDDVPGRLPQGCARRQGTALATTVRHLLSYPRPTPVPDGIRAECARGEGLEHACHPMASGPRYVLFRRPLADIGWTQRDCRAFLGHHGLDEEPSLACVACPLRSNQGWARLRATEPAAFAEAVAVDATLRHGHPEAALHGMPPGTTFFLHPDRVPLDQADLSADTDAVTDGCVPWACRGVEPGDAAWD